MDFAKAFTFVFDDPDWVKKIAIGGVLMFIPIIGQLMMMGYMIAIGRNVIRGNPQPMPDWSDFGQMAVDGLFTWIIGLVYVLPILVLACFFLVPMLAIGGVFSGDGELGAAGIVGVCCFVPFAIIYGIAMGWFFLPAAMARYADTGDVMSALRFGEILAISRANPIVFLMALVIAWVVSNVVAPLGLIGCCVGVLFTTFYGQCVTGHAYAQAYLVASEGVS